MSMTGCSKCGNSYADLIADPGGVSSVRDIRPGMIWLCPCGAVLELEAGGFRVLAEEEVAALPAALQKRLESESARVFLEQLIDQVGQRISCQGCGMAGLIPADVARTLIEGGRDVSALMCFRCYPRWLEHVKGCAVCQQQTIEGRPATESHQHWKDTRPPGWDAKPADRWPDLEGAGRLPIAFDATFTAAEGLAQAAPAEPSGVRISCPHCGETAGDRATKPGTICLCTTCGTVLRMGKDFRLHYLGEEEFNALPEEARARVQRALSVWMLERGGPTLPGVH